MPRRLVAALLVSSVLGGCGYSLRAPSPNRPRHEQPECDTNKSMVVIDGLMATALGIATLSLVGSEEPALALLPLSLGAIYLGGAIKGNTSVNKCNAAMSEYGGVEAAHDTLAVDDRDDSTPRARRPSEVVPQLPYTPTPYPGPQGASQPAYSPTNPPRVPGQYAAPAPAPIAAPPTNATPAPAQATPPPQPPRAAPAQPRVPPRAQPTEDSDWTDFWREVP
jgi:hypothetical protein